MREDTNSGAPLDLHEKMRKLQKHQAFEAEIVANQDRIVSVIGMGEQLIHDRRHHESPKIQRRLDALKKRWDELMTVSNNRGHGLEEAKDILKFNEEVDKVESWIREKVGQGAQSGGGGVVASCMSRPHNSIFTENDFIAGIVRSGYSALRIKTS